MTSELGVSCKGERYVRMARMGSIARLPPSENASRSVSETSVQPVWPDAAGPPPLPAYANAVVTYPGRTNRSRIASGNQMVPVSPNSLATTAATASA
jgi:hypothetical protein